MDPTTLSAADLSMAIHRRDLSCREVMTAYLDRIAQVNPAVNAIVAMRDPDELLAEATAADHHLAHGRSYGWMHGMPVAVKDLGATKGLRTTSGSRLLAEFVPAADCIMVERMRAAGCIVVGKTNVPEFGLGSHTYNDVYGTTFNAYDHTRSAGGSSGGAAVALATRMVPVADGSDYMGSLRNPAGWNNVFGFRPSQGRVPSVPEFDRYTPRMSTDGPMGRTVLDVALLLGTQAGPDPRDPHSLPDVLPAELTGPDAPSRAPALLRRSLHGVRIGWLADLDGHLATEPGVLDVCAEALQRCTELGAEVEPVSLPMPAEQVWDAWVVWRHHLVGSGLAPLVADPTHRPLMKPEALWEVDQAARLTGPQLAHAARVRTRFFHAITALFERFDALALPSAQVWPFPADQHWPTHIGAREMDTYHRWMETTIYATFAGLPAVCVPAGFGGAGLPMGVQLIGPPQGDLHVLGLAATYEPTISHVAVGGAAPAP
ncbi:MAG TPA: amidase [Acidimicrobiaceae bacterium]|nr:amidase [Acidimicrobiaceae bacterium]